MERVTLTPGLKVAAAVFGVLMIGLLVLNNLQIGAQLKVVEQQRDFQAQADPLVRDGRLLATGLRERLPTTERRGKEAARLVRDAAPLVAELRDTVPTLGALAEALSARTRLVRLVDRSDRLIAEVEDTGVLEATARAARRSPEFMDEVLRIQRETRELQRQSLAVQRETLAVQKEALAHIRSIDNKTGGNVPVR